MKNFIYILYLIVITVLALELALHIYNPVPSRIKGNKILLPANISSTINNEAIPKLDDIIYHNKNAIGLRGGNPPTGIENYLSIITVGGSTTECFYLSDDKTWSARLETKLKHKFKNIWLNNAGLDGHSTFGHQILLDDHLIKLKPKIILFLVGCNDVETDELNLRDLRSVKKYSTWLDYIIKESELINLVNNYIRYKLAAGVRHHNYDLKAQDTIPFTESFKRDKLTKINSYLPAYKARLQKLVSTCLENNISPVLITQPTLLGKGIDSITKVNLEKIVRSKQYNGKLYWEVLEKYNEQTRAVTAQHKILMVDLAAKMPKNSKYYYDPLHFTNEGAELVAQIIYQELAQYFTGKFPGSVK